MIATPETIRADKRWYAVHTRSRHEKKVGRLLEEHEVEGFVPLKRVLSQWVDRKEWVEKPFFPCYIFVRADEDEIPLVNATRGVVRVVGSEPHKPAVIHDQEIENIRILIDSQVRVDPYPYLKPGRTCYVRRGPLKGLEGTIVRKAKKHFIVVSVNLIGQSVLAEVSADAVEAP